jgi:hypothetical protein
MPYQKIVTNSELELSKDYFAVVYEGPRGKYPPLLEITCTKPKILLWSQLLTYLNLVGWYFKIVEKNEVAIITNCLEYGYINFLNIIGDISKFLIVKDEANFIRYNNFVDFANIKSVTKALEIIKEYYPTKANNYMGAGQTLINKFYF